MTLFFDIRYQPCEFVFIVATACKLCTVVRACQGCARNDEQKDTSEEQHHDGSYETSLAMCSGAEAV